MKNSKQIINKMQRCFPNVTKVIDAKHSIAVSVNEQDVKAGRRNQPGSCALAKACVREFKADGALINIGYSYIIKGDTAVRFKTSTTVGREITSFDRHHDFATGTDYLLCKISKGNELGARPPRPPGPKKGHLRSQPKPTIHRTVRIRKATVA